ncbi:hypothetical protein [Dactylosporangium matsuzakiense]|uniref:hypothetical protein n=1 Tax=Dactylosporangium matsuzakiense TaxID=53360 RepID=UPI0021C28F1C|nr:hypothetical protein [Dactylosporangium matsuzakiense]UWZ42017.1 hypothetical protein Dmats_30955 [Dactylosporangium matsuzakiense]
MRRTIAVLMVLVLGGCSQSATPQPATPSPAVPSPPAAEGALGAAPSAAASPSAAGPCTVFPADNVWHADVSKLPVSRDSAAWVASIGAAAKAHPDFGNGFGLPVTQVPAGQPKVKVTFQYADESDPGPYPIPKTARVESGGDRHVLVQDTAACRAYELFDAVLQPDGSWKAGSGAAYDLRSNTLRKSGWTSADAAGLPILPGLPRADEAAAGSIDHAIRFTAPKTRKAFIWPARHAASDAADAALPPMGARFRLKASVDISKFPPQARAVAQALKTHGAILADNGSPWYFSGTDDPKWSNTQLDALKTLKGTDFEAVDSSLLMVEPNSGRSRP